LEAITEEIALLAVEITRLLLPEPLKALFSTATRLDVSSQDARQAAYE